MLLKPHMAYLGTCICIDEGDGNARFVALSSAEREAKEILKLFCIFDMMMLYLVILSVIIPGNNDTV